MFRGLGFRGLGLAQIQVGDYRMYRHRVHIGVYRVYVWKLGDPCWRETIRSM